MEVSAFRTSVPFTSGSFLIGFGLLGAFDGIVFHQILQWHSVNMHSDLHGRILSDGLFHAFTAIALLIGAIELWRSTMQKQSQSGRMLLKWILIGGGSFNILEGIINHHILQLHHVKPGDPHELAHDLAFLALGVLLLVFGLLFSKKQVAH